MFSYRTTLLFLFATLCWGATVSAQTVHTPLQSVAQQSVAQQPAAQPQVQLQPIQVQPMQTQPVRVQPIQAPPMQMPPFGTQGGQPVHQISSQPMGQPVAGQVPMGTNVRQHTGQPNMGQPNMAQTNAGQQPPRMAANPVTPPPMGQSIPLYDASGGNRAPLTIQPGAAQPATPQPGIGSAVPGTPPGMQHMGRAAPENRIIPFHLNPAEQRELDDFLARWERFSASIRRYDVEFNLLEYDPTIPEAVPNVPHRTCFGHFRYISSPMRFLFVIEGEWRDNVKIRRDGDRNPHIHAERILITENAVFKYDYKAKTVHQINVPPEMIGRGIADSPLPLIFGAKADDLKRRFSMRVEHRQDARIVLYARPLLIEDQQEFRELVIMLERENLRALALKQYDINGMGYKVYELLHTRINDRLSNIFQDLADIFRSDIPRGWNHEVHDYPVAQPMPAPATPQMQVANPPQMSNPW